MIRGEQREERRERSAVDDNLRLVVVAGDDVAHGPQSRDEHRRALAAEKLHQPAADARLDHRLDLVVGAVAEVAQRPARIRQHLLVVGVHQPRERGERVAEELKLGLRLAAAKVGEGPRGVAEHGELGVLVELLQERVKRVLREHEIAALGGVASDVAEGPHRLLADVVGGRSEELDEDGDRSRIDDDAGVLGGSGRDVGERPRSLELELGERLALEKLDKVGHHASLDDLLDGGRALDGEELAEGGGGLDLDPGIVGLDALDHLGQALELCSRGGARVSARKRSEPAPFFRVRWERGEERSGRRRTLATLFVAADAVESP